MMPSLTRRMRGTLCSVFGVSLAACAAGTPGATLAPAPDTVVVVDTVEVRMGPDRERDRRAATLRLQLLERTAQVTDLQRRLDAAQQEIVRAMARFQTLASRAEAASVMAEAEIALEAVTGDAGNEEVPAAAQARRLLVLSTAEFANENYGGALYLASQARRMARTGEGWLANSEEEDRQPGEVLFALPLTLETALRSNVRAGPGLRFGVLFTLDPATPVVAYSHTEQWVRVTDDQGRSGWIFQNLVRSRREGGR
jgi:Bacterial SH3 domain